MTKRQQLIQALRALTPKALDDIQASLDGTEPIVVNQWFGKVEGKECGCLMIDGHVEELLRSYSASLSGTSEFLSALYGVNPKREWMGDYGCSLNLVEKAAFAFDKWAMNTTTYIVLLQAGGPRILTPVGRRAARKVMADARS